VNPLSVCLSHVIAELSHYVSKFLAKHIPVDNTLNPSDVFSET